MTGCNNLNQQRLSFPMACLKEINHIAVIEGALEVGPRDESCVALICTLEKRGRGHRLPCSKG
eukprot:6469977-Amphidinium_carterae.2